MKVIGLVTIVNGVSFGNRLQNYATQSVFEKLGYNIETINNRFEKNSAIKTVCEYLAASLLQFIPCISERMNRWIRGYTFYKWDKKYINYSKITVDASKEVSYMEPLNGKYDLFVTGSDQIWNPAYSSNSGFELLSFAAPIKRLSLSTSIGVEQIPIELRELYRKELIKFKALSVREESAIRLIEDITGIDNVELHIDPTLMLTRDEWKKFERKPDSFIQTEYLLCFFLTHPDAVTINIIERFAEQHNLIVVFLDKNLKNFERITPNNFVYIISHAKMICTDSFHCTVFSLIFGKALAVFDRFDSDKVNSRFRTLLKTVSKDFFWLGKLVSIEKLEENYSCTEYDIEKIIVKKRESVYQYIKNTCE